MFPSPFFKYGGYRPYQRGGPRTGRDENSEKKEERTSERPCLTEEEREGSRVRFFWGGGRLLGRCYTYFSVCKNSGDGFQTLILTRGVFALHVKALLFLGYTHKGKFNFSFIFK